MVTGKYAVTYLTLLMSAGKVMEVWFVRTSHIYSASAKSK